MNSEQLAAARIHLEELKYGMKIEDVRALGLRDFCKRKERKRNKVRLSLYALTPEWLKYVQEHNAIVNMKNEESNIADASSVVDEEHNEEKSNTLEQINDFSSFIHEISMTKTANTQGDASLAKLENALINGECHINNTFDRATLLFRYYDQLINPGMTMIELIKADLVGMITQFLDYNYRTERYWIKDVHTRVYLMYLIHKYYRKDIIEYRNFIFSIYSKMKSSFSSHKLTFIPSHLYATIRKFNKTVTYDITYKDFWELANSMEIGNEKLINTDKWKNTLTIERRKFIIQVVKECNQEMKEYEAQLKHPFQIETFALTAFVYTIVVDLESTGSTINLSKIDTLFDKLKQTNWNEVSSIVEQLEKQNLKASNL